jgi:hypothetical protein
VRGIDGSIRAAVDILAEPVTGCHQVMSLLVAHGFSACCSGLVRPTVARTVTASRIPRTAAAVSGIV